MRRLRNALPDYGRDRAACPAGRHPPSARGFGLAWCHSAYDTKDRKITVNEADAGTVRTIFHLYLKLGSLSLLMAELRKRGIVSRIRTLKSGKTVGGIPFTRGPLAHRLRNRFYIGEMAFKGEVLRGEQPAILDRELFEAVQAKLDAQAQSQTVRHSKSEALLMGRIFDDAGNRMTPSHARKRSVKYRNIEPFSANRVSGFRETRILGPETKPRNHP